jgi:hypothetical protein
MKQSLAFQAQQWYSRRVSDGIGELYPPRPRQICGKYGDAVTCRQQRRGQMMHDIFGATLTGQKIADEHADIHRSKAGLCVPKERKLRAITLREVYGSKDGDSKV